MEETGIGTLVIVLYLAMTCLAMTIVVQSVMVRWLVLVGARWYALAPGKEQEVSRDSIYPSDRTPTNLPTFSLPATI